MKFCLVEQFRTHLYVVMLLQRMSNCFEDKTFMSSEVLRLYIMVLSGYHHLINQSDKEIRKSEEAQFSDVDPINVNLRNFF